MMMQLTRWAIAITASIVAALPCAAAEPRDVNLKEGLSDQSPSAELFLRAYTVFAHRRCSNCHPADDRPRWGQTGEIHGMNVQRDPVDPKQEEHGNYGRVGMNCFTCHQSSNSKVPDSPPGAENWRLAPKSMGWGGLPAAELCDHLKKQGVEKAVEHIVGKLDALVAWAWDPGPDRKAVPGTSKQFITIMNWWVKSGAGCPS